MKQILVCEDEDAIRDFVVINLNRSGYETTDVSNGEEAIKIFQKPDSNFDIVLIDIMMPGVDGFEVCRQIRKADENVGIIMLTAKTQEMDKVRGLMLGADDYISKPFSPSELIARVDAIYRRVSMIGASSKKTEIIISGPFKFNKNDRVLTKNDKPVELTQVEYQLITLFFKNPNVAMERTHILREVWGKDYFGDVKIVDVNIRRLRIKIEDDPSFPTYIQTVWGYGYKWNDK